MGVGQVCKVLEKHIPTTHFSYWLGMFGDSFFDLLAFMTCRKFTISSMRVNKYCATTQFDSTKEKTFGFETPYTIDEG